MMESKSDSLSIYETFDSMNLNEDLLRGIVSYGFENPSSIQQRGIMPLIKGRDTLAQAQSGTGKTGTFSIGILQSIDPKLNETQAIILAPIRELAQQITNVIGSLSQYMTDVKVRCCVGGKSVRGDISALKAGVHIVVGTPGRMYHMLEKGFLNTDSIKLIVLDEADKMLELGFKEQVNDIFQFLKKDIQVGLFSATVPDDTKDIVKTFMRDPAIILVKSAELTLDGIKQFYLKLEKEYKEDALFDIYEKITTTQTIIYCNSRRKVDEMVAKMIARDFTVSATHGDMEMNERERVMEDFRSGTSRVLITTDLMARGIDVQQVSLVINYDIPRDIPNYIHRIGRSGRYGRKGVAINFVTERDMGQMKEIENYYSTTIDELTDMIVQGL
jgi:translation initiation factor 4A